MSLEAVFETDGAVRYGDVRDALSAVEDDAVSESSPVSGGLSEVAVVVADSVIITVSGHGAGWTKTSQQAVVSAVESTDGVSGLAAIDGGYSASGTESGDGDDE